MTLLPLVTVLIPTRNEAADIEGCLAAVAAQDYPINRIEVLVVDGASDDGTADIAVRVLGRYGFGSTAVLHNAGRTTPSNLNIGLEKATGAILCRVDARTRIQPHYVRTCADLLASRSKISVVGGAQIAVARDPTAKAVGIARALNNRWSMGGSPYRRARRSGVSDTVYLGAFRTDDLRKAQGWDLRFPTNQDFELNTRMAQRGLVWYEASLRSGYLPRATFRALWRQFDRFGRAKVDFWRLTGRAPEPRQWMLLAGPPLVLAVAVGAMARSTIPSRMATGLLAVTAAGAAAIERAGADEPRGGLTADFAGVVAMMLIGAGWWTGVARQLVARATDPDPQ